MADQMTPAELRAHADLIADRYNIQDGEPALWRAMVHVVQAARNLADVIEYVEDMYGGEGMGEYLVDCDAGSVWRIARGDTTNHENRSGDDA